MVLILGAKVCKNYVGGVKKRLRKKYGVRFPNEKK